MKQPQERTAIWSTFAVTRDKATYDEPFHVSNRNASDWAMPTDSDVPVVAAPE